MGERRVYHIIPHSDGGWAIKEAGSALPIIAFHSKDAAVAFAHNLAGLNRPSKLVVYKHDKSVEQETEFEDN